MIDFATIWKYLPKILDGAFTTLELMALSLFIGALIALPVALMRLSQNKYIRWPAYGYIFFFRGTPLLVQIFLIYYGLSQFEFIRESFMWAVLREAYWCAIIAFSLNTGAYTAEILRGAIQAVPKGQVEAAKSMGMNPVQVFRRVVFPQAIRIAVPAYGNEIILMLKGSALASTITLLDLTGMTQTVIARTYMQTEFLIVAGLFYLAITYVLTRGFKIIETRVSRHMKPANG
ncbi:MAG: ABC transporter permease [Rhodospirillaceae bacterium]|nr:ABC transporter permease [Rhodospirillaceae bacterium]